MDFVTVQWVGIFLQVMAERPQKVWYDKEREKLLKTESGGNIMDERLQKQLDFILEIDKEKNIFRQTHLKRPRAQ